MWVTEHFWMAYSFSVPSLFREFPWFYRTEVLIPKQPTTLHEASACLCRELAREWSEHFENGISPNKSVFSPITSVIASFYFGFTSVSLRFTSVLAF